MLHITAAGRVIFPKWNEANTEKEMMFQARTLTSFGYAVGTKLIHCLLAKFWLSQCIGFLNISATLNIFSYLRVAYSFITIYTELPSSIGYLFNDESLKILIPGTELEKRFCKQLKKECLSKQGKLLNSDTFRTILLIKISYVFLHLIN